MATYFGSQDGWSYDGEYTEFTTFTFPQIWIEISGYDEFSWWLREKLG